MEKGVEDFRGQFLEELTFHTGELGPGPSSASPDFLQIRQKRQNKRPYKSHKPQKLIWKQ